MRERSDTQTDKHDDLINYIGTRANARRPVAYVDLWYIYSTFKIVQNVTYNTCHRRAPPVAPAPAAPLCPVTLGSLIYHNFTPY